MVATLRAPGAPTPEIKQAIATAADKTGVPFDFLLRQAAVESCFDANAKARTSSATGLYQFIERTWLEMVRDHGAKHGIGDLARSVGHDGKVSDAETRRRILDLRSDAKLASAMAGEYAQANRARLKTALGREPGATDIYLAHFLGPQGAIEFLAARRAGGAKDAATVLPAAASANRGVFFAADGRTRSLNDVYDRFAGLFGSDPSVVGRGPEARPVERAAAAAARDIAASLLAGRALSPFAVAALAALDEAAPLRSR